jgi:tetratricopeptide (TPR) repeat protein
MRPEQMQQIRRWSEEVAKDPASLSFLPLAAAYRASGRADVALKLVLRGLEHHSENVEAHLLLARLYQERGDLLRAMDEWGIALRLHPEQTEARRELALALLQSGDAAAAVPQLERALQLAPADAELIEALQRARRVEAEATAEGKAEAKAEATVVEEPGALDAGSTFTAPERGVLGAVLLDAEGRVLVGELKVEGEDRAAELAAALRGASDDAVLAAQHLGLGAWTSILLETPQATVHLAPLPEAMLAVAGERSVPPGRLVRQARRLRADAERWLGAGEGE